MTPSGKLYEVDTRLRPNGRAGALVSSLTAFRDYQLKEAWTWEMQALTRSRFIAGNTALKSKFEQIRLDALCRERSEQDLRRDLMEMRQKMVLEHASGTPMGTASALKQGSGGLVDIEFIAQLGILHSAQAFPRVLQATGTLQQLAELECIQWLSATEAEQLAATWKELSLQRMMNSLVPDEKHPDPDTHTSAQLFDERVGRSAK
jgi:glutamate-ammonia-ligase adenylyltransferase